MSKLNVTKSVTYNLITDEEGETIALSNREDITRLILNMDEAKKALKVAYKFLGTILDDHNEASERLGRALEKLENKSIEDILK